jgi:hypothetical protein
MAMLRWSQDCRTAIGNVPPAIYAKLSDPAKQRDGSLRYAMASGAVPLHHRANGAQMTFELHFQLDETRGSGHVYNALRHEG